MGWGERPHQCFTWANFVGVENRNKAFSHLWYQRVLATSRSSLTRWPKGLLPQEEQWLWEDKMGSEGKKAENPYKGKWIDRLNMSCKSGPASTWRSKREREREEMPRHVPKQRNNSPALIKVSWSPLDPFWPALSRGEMSDRHVLIDL